MPVIDTFSWLEQYAKSQQTSEKKSLFYEQEKVVCRPLKAYFPGASEYEIHNHLLSAGLSQPADSAAGFLSRAEKSGLHRKANRQFEELRQEWKGPDVPVFLLPSDLNNPQLVKAFNGKAGLAFADKLFLFVPPDLKEKELKALLTHEYHHVCRARKLNRPEKEMTLLDSIIMEGLAEKAAEMRTDAGSLAIWTSIYPLSKAKSLFTKYLSSRLQVTKYQPVHDKLLYGGGMLPKWLGYNCGWHIVDSWHEKQGSMDTESLISAPAEAVLADSAFSYRSTKE
ncbi:DUF2268 domain-containing protein [Bacillus marinisedimentorum]|uniref:DUF2268 domain-containing protein n=1 Tax=Bacillus marinisedimentorum TaxID=1821260 RepID=UPI0008734BDF|nr:DUF2268 domain-containing putative Zn-dependent protease [Bacillus marinisedimentorum]